MKKEDKNLIIELFNYNNEVSNMIRLNIIISVWFVSALILTTLIFRANNILGRIIATTFGLIVWVVGVGYGLFHHSKKHKELIKHRSKIKKLLK